MDKIQEAEKFYDRIRERVVSEDDLYHRRLTSLISMQAFLFATVGLMLRPLSEGGEGRNALLVVGGFVLIAAMGVMVALVTARVIGDGKAAMEELRCGWNKYKEQYEYIHDEGALILFPHPRGWHRPEPGRMSTDHLPWIFIAVWGGFVLLAAIWFLSASGAPDLALPEECAMMCGKTCTGERHGDAGA